VDYREIIFSIEPPDRIESGSNGFVIRWYKFHLGHRHRDLNVAFVSDPLDVIRDAFIAAAFAQEQHTCH